MSASAEKSIFGDMAAAVKAVKFEVSVVSEFPAPPYLSRSMRHAATPLPLAVANAARSFCFVVLTMIEKSVALSKLHSWSRNAYRVYFLCGQVCETRPEPGDQVWIWFRMLASRCGGGGRLDRLQRVRGT